MLSEKPFSIENKNTPIQSRCFYFPFPPPGASPDARSGQGAHARHAALGKNPNTRCVVRARLLCGSHAHGERVLRNKFVTEQTISLISAQQSRRGVERKRVEGGTDLPRQTFPPCVTVPSPSRRSKRRSRRLERPRPSVRIGRPRPRCRTAGALRRPDLRGARVGRRFRGRGRPIHPLLFGGMGVVDLPKPSAPYPGREDIERINTREGIIRRRRLTGVRTGNHSHPNHLHLLDFRLRSPPFHF